jgi:predicted SPOUT superfamily RNA methylase MTH1
MREAISTIEDGYIQIKDISPQKYYGFETHESKGFVSRVENGDGENAYVAVYADDITTGTYMPMAYENPTLENFMEELIHYANVYEFETAPELYQWLGSQNENYIN